MHANARLIASAPELLAALEKIDRVLSATEGYEHACLTEDTSEDAITCGKIVRAAIAKAKGQS